MHQAETEICNVLPMINLHKKQLIGTNGHWC